MLKIFQANFFANMSKRHEAIERGQRDGCRHVDGVERPQGRFGERARSQEQALIDRGEERGCVDLKEVDELAQALDLEDEDLGALYEQLHARHIELRLEARPWQDQKWNINTMLGFNDEPEPTPEPDYADVPF